MSIFQIVFTVFEQGFLTAEQEQLIGQKLASGSASMGDLEAIDQLMQALMSNTVSLVA